MQKCSAWKDSGLQNKIVGPLPREFWLIVVFWMESEGGGGVCNSLAKPTCKCLATLIRFVKNFNKKIKQTTQIIVNCTALLFLTVGKKIISFKLIYHFLEMLMFECFLLLQG